MISGEIKRFLRDDGMIKVSRSLKETAYRAYLAGEKIREESGREATIEEIAEKIEVEKETLILAIEASTEVESLQKTIYQGDGNEILLMDKIVEEEEREEKILDMMLLRPAKWRERKTGQNMAVTFWNQHLCEYPAETGI